jgi:tRNA A-37 threonylcarbamoyl transferase component Bud32
MGGDADKRGTESTLSSGGTESTLQGDLKVASSPTAATESSGRYIIENEFARGGLGRVLKARDQRLKRSVAIKQLLSESADVRARFMREAMVTARLQHPSIVPIYDVGTLENGEPFYAMKLISGTPMDALIRERVSLTERLALLPNMIAVAEAVAYAHSERVIHRDLKPGNIIVGDFGETIVIDWGLAKDLASTDATESGEATVPDAPAATVEGAVMGTPLYMPPEQARGSLLDERSDVYSLGAVLYHLLAGRPPYDGATSAAVLAQVMSEDPRPISLVQPEVPRELQAIISKAMERRPGGRYPSARELAEELKRFQTGQLVAAHSYSLNELLRRWIQRNRTALSIAAISAVVLAIVAVGLLRQVSTVRRRTAETAQKQRTINQAEVATRLALEEVQAVRDTAIQLAGTPEMANSISRTDSSIRDLITSRARNAPPAFVQVFDETGRPILDQLVNLEPRWSRTLGLDPTAPVVQRALQYERVTTIAAVDGTLVVQASAPIVDRLYRLRGVVVLDAPMDGKFASRLTRSLPGGEVLLHAGGAPGYASFLYTSGADEASFGLPAEVAGDGWRDLQYVPRATVNGREYSLAYSRLHGAAGDSVGVLGVAVERGGAL